MTQEGWYPDPTGRYLERRWNGVAWTDVVRNDGPARKEYRSEFRGAPTTSTPGPGDATLDQAAGGTTTVLEADQQVHQAGRDEASADRSPLVYVLFGVLATVLVFALIIGVMAMARASENSATGGPCDAPLNATKALKSPKTSQGLCGTVEISGMRALKVAPKGSASAANPACTVVANWMSASNPRQPHIGVFTQSPCGSGPAFTSYQRFSASVVVDGTRRLGPNGRSVPAFQVRSLTPLLS